MLALGASPPAWVLQLHVACMSLQAHGLCWFQCVYLAGCICGCTDGSGRQLRLVELILFKSFTVLTAKSDCSDYSCSTLQYHFWIEIKRWGVCLTLLLIPCSSHSNLSRESPASEEQSRDPGLFSILQGSRAPLLVSFLPFVPFPELCWLEPGSSALLWCLLGQGQSR